MLINALNGKQLPLYGDGHNVRDWLYVEGHCQAIDLVLEQGRIGETYNIGGSNERSNVEIVRQIWGMLDIFFLEESGLQERFPHCPAACRDKSDTLITYVTDRPGHDRRYSINATVPVQSLVIYRPRPWTRVWPKQSPGTSRTSHGGEARGK